MKIPILSVAIILILFVAESQEDTHVYNGNVYYLSYPFKRNWYQAYQICNQNHMELLFIESKVESDFIVNLIKTTYEYSRGGSYYWIGATDLGSERDFYWLSTGKHVDHANWAPDEPSWGERCVHLSASHNFMWNNKDCNFYGYFICKSKPCVK